MSSGNPTGFYSNFFTSAQLSSAKNLLDIPDANDDSTLNDLGVQSVSDFTLKIYPYSNGLPLDGDYLTMAQNAIIFRVCSLWKAKKSNFELAKYYDGLYKTEVENFITSFKANLNTRTKRVSVVTDYKTVKTYAEVRKW